VRPRSPWHLSPSSDIGQREPEVIGPVDPGPEVLGRGDTHQLAELLSEMRLVSVAVLRG
jgi:hypothetical protein